MAVPKQSIVMGELQQAYLTGTELPQQVSFEVFRKQAVLKPLLNHGRVAAVHFNGHDCGFVDLIGVEGLRQAHRAEVNNALYANSPDALAFLARPLPSTEALLDYPELFERFPKAASKVRVKDRQMPDFKPPQDWEPAFSRWRHGGWYVNNVRYPSGAVGCVSNNYQDKKWRIACDDRRLNLGEPGDFTFSSRDAAARAESALVKSLEYDITMQQERKVPKANALSQVEWQELGGEELVSCIQNSGFSVSGPTDIRAAENGEPVWVCEARTALAEITNATRKLDDNKQENNVNNTLCEAVAELKAARDEVGAGQLNPLEFARVREESIGRALVAVAADCGVTLEQPVQIDSNGEYSVVVKQEATYSGWGQAQYGPTLAEVLNQHNPRTGVAPGACMAADNSWCHLNHFAAEALVMDYVQKGVFRNGVATDTFRLFPTVQQVSDGQYAGKLVGFTGQLAVQDVGRGKFVAHDASAWESRPAVNELVVVKYMGQKAEVTSEQQGKGGPER